MRVQIRHFPGMRATRGVGNQIRAIRLGEIIDHISFGFPNERILNGERLFRQEGEKPGESIEHFRVCGAGGASTDDLRRRRQVQAYYAVLIKTERESPNS